MLVAVTPDAVPIWALLSTGGKSSAKSGELNKSEKPSTDDAAEKLPIAGSSS
jgi:hypothetical protein